MSYYPGNYAPPNIHPSQIYPTLRKNRDYLIGQRSHITSQASPTALFLFTGVFLLLFAIALYFGLTDWFNRMNLEEHRLSAQARITGQHTTHSRSSTTYYLTYSFTVKGKNFTKETDVSSDTYRSHPIGSSIGILYLPADPTNSEIPNQGLVGGLILAAVLMIIAIGLGIASWWNLRLNRLVERKGIFLPAQPTDARTVRIKNGRALKLTYQFMRPDGQIIIRKTQLPLNSYTKAIGPNTWLGVLYYDDRHFRLL